MIWGVLLDLLYLDDGSPCLGEYDCAHVMLDNIKRRYKTMIEKLEKVLDLAAEALSLYVRKTTLELGEGLPLPPVTPSDNQLAPKKDEPEPKKVRARKKTEPAPAPAAEAPAKSPFDVGAPTAPPAALTVEEQAKAKIDCESAMGVFIRRHLKSTPPGLARAKVILKQTLGRDIAKLEDLVYADHVKLVPVFLAALDNPDAGVLK